MQKRKPAPIVLWALTGRVSRTTCVLQAIEDEIELQLLRGGRVAARQRLPDWGHAERRASALRQLLLLRGWWDVTH